ncbi:MAG: DUF4065 domain-containing protein [Chloroflexota bacterium]|nr:DUF4065 domain-containing protein [Chloroflexota bacterium]
MPSTAADVANYFIWRANADEEYGENITNLKLQKLVYYAQGFHLAWYGEPLFPEPIEAWAHGPVVRPLYFEYQRHGANPLQTPEGFDPGTIDERTRQLLEEVYQVYGQYSAWALRNLTHEEAPWKDTPRNAAIPHEAMRTFFADQLTVG